MGRIKLYVDGIDVTALAIISASDISYTPAASAAALEVGAHTVYLTVSNSANATAQSVWGFKIDEQSVYSVSITAPAKDATQTSMTEVEVTATANKSYANRVTLNSNGSARTRTPVRRPQRNGQRHSRSTQETTRSQPRLNLLMDRRERQRAGSTSTRHRSSNSRTRATSAPLVRTT